MQPFEVCGICAGLLLTERERFGFVKVFIGSGLKNGERAEQITELLETFLYHSVLARTELLLGSSAASLGVFTPWGHRGRGDIPCPAEVHPSPAPGMLQP